MVAAPGVRVADASRTSGAWRVQLAYVVALAVALPLFVSALQAGLRLARFDPVLGAIDPMDAPLSTRSPPGVYALAVTLVWFGLAYRSRDVPVWHAALVGLAGLAVLLRVGNGWLDGLALVVPFGYQLCGVGRPWLAASGIVGAAAAGGLLIMAQPPPLPSQAVEAARAVDVHGPVMTDWRWAPVLQKQLGSSASVLAAHGTASEPTQFWVDYERASFGHERWAQILRTNGVRLVVLNETNQHALAELVRGSADWQVLYDGDNALVALASDSQ